MALEAGEQILKTRDDALPVGISKNDDQTDVGKPYKVASTCSWARVDEAIGPERIRARIEPWLTALVQSEHLALLCGSGLTHGVHYLAAGSGAAGMGKVAFATSGAEIDAEAKRSALSAGRASTNFEDQMRVAAELLRGLEILASTKDDTSAEAMARDSLKSEIVDALKSFAASILTTELSLVNSPKNERETALNYLVSFLMSFASRSGTRERLQLFTTNYDRYIELGAEVAGLRLIDRFVGMLTPTFRASRLDVDLHYNPPGIRGEPRYLEGVAHFTKLHGSVDWVDFQGAIRRLGLPFGAKSVDPYLGAPSFGAADASRLMVFPNSAKDRETASFPYVELFRDLAASVCRPNSTLVCYGYSFGDEHINRVIEDMLTIPSAHLVVIAHGDPLGRIMSMYERVGRHAQISLLLGDHLGDLASLVDNYLPKPAIDRTTFRMAELLKARWGSTDTSTTTMSSPIQPETQA